MGVTALKRKARRNITKTAVRKQNMKLLNRKPVIKKVDIEALKSGSTETIVERASKTVKSAVENILGK